MHQPTIRLFVFLIPCPSSSPLPPTRTRSYPLVPDFGTVKLFDHTTTKGKTHISTNLKIGTRGYVREFAKQL